MTGTATATFTDVDVYRVYSRLRADLQMIAESTGLWTEEWVDKLVYDLTLLAIKGYLERIEVYLKDGWGRVLQAELYTPSTDASSWAAQSPSCRWSRVPDGQVTLITRYAPAYYAQTPADRTWLESQLKLSWTTTTFSADLSRLSVAEERTYVSNSYGLRRVSIR
jgi:hypothetical protein